VVRPRAPNCTHGRPDHHGDADLAVRRVVNRGRLLHNLPHGFHDHVEEHNVDDWTQARGRRSHTNANLSQFGNRRIAYAPFAELLPESLTLFVVPAPRADALTEIDDRRIAPHLLLQRFNTRLNELNLAHGLDRRERFRRKLNWI
jgi:hypothetical protein